MKFTVPGDPKPQGRPRFFRRGAFVGTYDPKDSASFKQKVGFYAVEAGMTLSDGPLALSAKFYIKRPKNRCRSKDDRGAIVCSKRPDLDNLVKAILDGLNGIAFKDDGQVCVMELRKFYHEVDKAQRTEIEILPI